METALPAQLRDRVERALDRIRPALVADGGNVELLGIGDDGTVRVLLQGNCARCPAQVATLRFAIEAPLRRLLPQIPAVVAHSGDPTPVD